MTPTNGVLFFYVLHLADYAAGDFGAGVACRLGVEIVRHTMNYHRPPEDISYTQMACRHRQIGVSVAVH